MLSLLVVALLVASTMQLGTIYVNIINGNLDLVTGEQKVTIEQVIIDDDTIFVDFIGELETVGTGGGSGTVIEDTLFKDGSTFIPKNLDVGEVATISGRLIPNGGIRADSLFEDFPSFTVDDDTGVTTLLGILFQNDNINADDGLFFVDGETGETTIQGLTRPDGGISVLTDVFEVISDTGDVFVSANLLVEKDIVFVNPTITDSGIYRVDSFLNGGDTYIRGQNAASYGGNLVLSPGYGSGTITNNAEPFTFNGEILVGRDQPDDITVGRQNHVDGGDAGATVLSGQDAGGKGGSLYLESGRGQEGFGDGAIYLVPGGDPEISGDIILGQTDTHVSASTLRVARPTLFSGQDGGLTFIIGQDTTFGNTAGGDVTVRAGNGDLPGNIFLLPGESDKNGDGGIIFIGDEVGAELFVSRGENTIGSAGATRYQGQSSFNFDGGDVFIVAGKGGSDTSTQYPGGDIFLTPGSPAAGEKAGAIYWGSNDADLVVSRQDAVNTAGFRLVIAGQDSISTAPVAGPLTVIAGSSTTLNGGDLYLVGGDGNFVGGDIQIGGGVTVLAANTQGGDVTISAGGDSAETVDGGDITIAAGTGTFPGTLFIESGDSLNLGSVSVTGVTDFALEAADFIFIQNSAATTPFRLVNGANSVSLSSDPTAILTATEGLNSVVIRNRFLDPTNSITYPTINASDDFYGYAGVITVALNHLYDGLANHHTLISPVSPV